MSQFDTEASCVCCDRPILLRSVDWSPTVAPVCLTCLANTPFYVIRAVFVLRTQISHLWNNLNELKKELTAPS